MPKGCSGVPCFDLQTDPPPPERGDPTGHEDEDRPGRPPARRRLPRRQRDLSDAAARVRAEVRGIEAFLLHGRLRTARVLDTAYHARWVLAGEAVDLFVNTHPTATRRVRVPAGPRGGVGSPGPVGRDREASLRVDGDRFVVELAPQSVQLYRGRLPG